MKGASTNARSFVASSSTATNREQKRMIVYARQNHQLSHIPEESHSEELLYKESQYHQDP